MNRKQYWMILFNPIFLVLYGYGLSVIYDFCKYGNVMRRVPLIMIIFTAGVLWFILWTILYFVLKKKRGRSEWTKKAHWILMMELVVLILITGFYGQKIYKTTQPYSGKLGSYLSDLKTKREFALDDSERDFLENGLDGILASLSEHCGLDTNWSLYTANTLTVNIDQSGTIQSLEAFLYAFDEGDNFHSWLISFDSAKSEKMTVYLDGYADTTYAEQEQMEPLFVMIDALLHSDLPASLGVTDAENKDDQTLLVMKYSGYINGNYQTDIPGTWYIVTKSNEETQESYRLTDYTAPVHGVSDEGFLFTIYSDDYKLATIATGIGTMETISDIQEQEKEKDEIESAKEQGGTLISDDGGMTFYLDENTSMSLIVVDAAAGSRAYAFRNGRFYNEDPFNGSIGVAESIYFLDESIGFILLTTASQDYSSMYYTQDGGETFTKVILPVSDGEEDMAGNEFNYTSEDMDYINVPYEEEGCLYVVVSYDYSGAKYMSMLFRSEDNGQSWQYLSYEENL